MAERVIVRQNNRFQTEIFAPDPQNPESDTLHSVAHLYDLTPYGMLLASLGSCTAVLLNTYSQNRGLDLSEVELRLRYERNFKKDCENCEGIEKYEEHIEQEVVLAGGISTKEREKLFMISYHCPIHKMLAGGIKVQSRLADK